MANQSTSEFPGIRREKILLRRPSQDDGQPARQVDLESLAEAMNSGSLAREISAANDDPELAV